MVQSPLKGKTNFETLSQYEQQMAQNLHLLSQKCIAILDPNSNLNLQQLNHFGIYIYGSKLHFKEYEEADENVTPTPSSPQNIQAAAKSVRNASSASEKEGSTDLEFHSAKPTSRCYHLSHQSMKSYAKSFYPDNLGIHRLYI
jgi:hypothetical protein